MSRSTYPDKIALLALPCDNEQTIESEPVEDREDPSIHFRYGWIPNQEGELRDNPRPSGIDGPRVGPVDRKTVKEMGWRVSYDSR